MVNILVKITLKNNTYINNITEIIENFVASKLQEMSKAQEDITEKEHLMSPEEYIERKAYTDGKESAFNEIKEFLDTYNKVQKYL